MSYLDRVESQLDRALADIRTLRAENERLRAALIEKEAELDWTDTAMQYIGNHFPSQLEEAERHADAIAGQIGAPE